MANLFVKQAKQYALARPTYPDSLFHFISSKTPQHLLAWDAGTGSGQAAKSIAKIYSKVIATDTSATQIEHAPSIPNVIFRHTPPTIPISSLSSTIASPSTVDLITVAQALHWFDLPHFYSIATTVLKKPHGVLAAWCYTTPSISPSVDPVFAEFHIVRSKPYWDEARRMVEDRYEGLEFPFEAVEGCEGTGPFEFTAEVRMGFEELLVYLRSWSAYQTAKERGVELLSEEMVEEFRAAWGRDGGEEEKVVKFPVFLRIGKVGEGKGE